MVDHRRRQHFFGKRQEFRRERAGHHRWIFDEVRDLVEQRRMMRRRTADPASEAARLRFETSRDPILAFLPIQHDEVLGEPRLVIFKRTHFHGPAGAAARREKPVAVGEGGRDHFLHRRRLRQLGAANRKRDDAAAIQVENPADRTAEQQLAFAIFEERVPMHRLRKTERAQRGGQDVRQHVDGGLAALMLAVPEVHTFRRLHFLELRDVDAVLSGKPDGRIGRLTIGAVCRSHRRPGDELVEIGLALGNFRDARRQPSRCAVAFNRRVGQQPARPERAVETVPDLLRQAREPRGGQFFSTDFEQHFPFHRYAFTSRRRRRIIAAARPASRAYILISGPAAARTWPSSAACRTRRRA